MNVYKAISCAIAAIIFFPALALAMETHEGHDNDIGEAIDIFREAFPADEGEISRDKEKHLDQLLSPSREYTCRQIKSYANAFFTVAFEYIAKGASEERILRAISVLTKETRALLERSDIVPRQTGPSFRRYFMQNRHSFLIVESQRGDFVPVVLEMGKLESVYLNDIDAYKFAPLPCHYENGSQMALLFAGDDIVCSDGYIVERSEFGLKVHLYTGDTEPNEFSLADPDAKMDGIIVPSSHKFMFVPRSGDNDSYLPAPQEI